MLIRKCSFMCAGIFYLADLMFIFVIHYYNVFISAASQMIDHDSLVLDLILAWNVLHTPIRSIIEPMLFPAITSDMIYQDSYLFYIYYFLCALQFAVLGYLFGKLKGSEPFNKF